MLEKVREIKINNNVTIGGNKRFTFIGGPCAIESEKLCLDVASELKKICNDLNIDFVFKSSFDKANRTSVNSKRGVGMEKGLAILKKVKQELDIPIITDVHESYQCDIVANIVDIIQIPAFLCRQTDLLISAGKTGKAINVKKGQFLAPWDMENIVKKIETTGNSNIMLCERGTTFGYNNLVVDSTSVVEMRKFNCPVIMDATHSVQKPGGKGTTTGGNRNMVPYLINSSLSMGVDGIFAEVHPDPDNAFSDGPNQIALENIYNILKTAIMYDNITKEI